MTPRVIPAINFDRAAYHAAAAQAVRERAAVFATVAIHLDCRHLTELARSSKGQSAEDAVEDEQK